MQRFDFDEVDSTNTQAAARAKALAGEVVLVTAKTQTAGRGRWGRVWRSPAGGAWFSLVLPLEAVNDLISIEAARAVRVALSSWVSAERLTIKAPNDVMLDGDKVAGILCEQTVVPGEAGTTAVVGVGVNVNVEPASLGEGLRHPATSLSAALGRDVEVEAVIERCVKALRERLGGCRGSSS